MKLQTKALEIAKTFADAKVREHPPKSNRGLEIDMFNERAGTALGSPWCASFVYYCIDEAAKALGVENPFADMDGKAWTPNYKLWGEKHDAIVKGKYEPGSIFALWYPHLKPARIGHIGFIAGEPVNGRVPTIEGNTDTQGSRTGGGVFERTRSIRLYRIIQYGTAEWKLAAWNLYPLLAGEEPEKLMRLIQDERNADGELERVVCTRDLNIIINELKRRSA